MSRLIRMVLLGAVALSLVGGGTHAYLNDSETNANNVFRVGTVEVGLAPTSAAFDVPALAPGGEATSTLTVKNEGTLPYTFAVSARKTAGYTAVFESLTCTVTAGAAGPLLYAGLLSALDSTPRLVAAGASEPLSMAVGLPAAAGKEVAGDYCRVTFDVDAEQQH